MTGEYKNIIKGIMAITPVMLLAAAALGRMAYYAGAGTAAFNLSLLFVTAQTLVILGAYILWYRKTSQEAEDMMNIVDKRRMAYHYKNKYILISVAATGGIALAAVVCMLLNILFAGIAPLYCYTSVLTMFVAGNLVLYLSIRFWGLPNAVTGIY